MKKNLFLLVLLLLLAAPARAQFTVNLDAGQLTGTNGITSGTNAMQIDTLNNGAGSLLLLVDIGTTDTIDTALIAGHFVAGADTILAAGSFNNGGLGVNETSNAFNNITSGTVGDNIALLWFPQITYNQYEGGTLTVAGDYFGAYTPSPAGSTPDDGQTWTVPGAGATIGLNFFTVDDEEGSQPNSAGYANYQVESAPEPSTFALFGVGSLIVFWSVRRRKAV